MRERGNLGEKIAKDYLRGKGFKILESQFFARVGEIDIVAECAGKLHFVEVKARSSAAFGYPEEAITEKKAERIRKAVGIYLLRNKISHQNYQIDLVAIDLELDSRKARVRYIENAIGE